VKYTLLQMVQSIMSDMDSDAIDHVTDNDESQQVASTIRDVYFQLVSTQSIPEFQALCKLESAGTLARNFMKIPDTVKEIYSIRYNVQKLGDTRDAFSPIKYYTPEDFLQRISLNDSSATNIFLSTDPTSGVTLSVLNDKRPEIWTIFDDLYICFDSYDAAVDTTGLVASKTRCWGSLTQDTFDITDDNTVAVMDDNFFPMLLAEAKSTCFINLKHQANPKIERQSKNQRLWAQNEKHRTAASERESLSPTYPHFGRRRGSH